MLHSVLSCKTLRWQGPLHPSPLQGTQPQSMSQNVLSQHQKLSHSKPMALTGPKKRSRLVIWQTAWLRCLLNPKELATLVSHLNIHYGFCFLFSKLTHWSQERLQVSYRYEHFLIMDLTWISLFAPQSQVACLSKHSFWKVPHLGWSNKHLLTPSSSIITPAIHLSTSLPSGCSLMTHLYARMVRPGISS